MKTSDEQQLRQEEVMNNKNWRKRMTNNNKGIFFIKWDTQDG
jgi:hypothetical protein